uniref:Uncharacterized protein n=1 Tax=Arundo donax TaxID=35708 RepID=A0A0A8ZL55_ARUDO
MDSSSLHGHGLVDSGVHCVVWVISSAMGITQYSTDILDDELQSWLCMWMISS